MKRLAIAFTGPSNSGKTTLIEKISLALTPKYKVAIIKHDPKDKAIFDIVGKDSDRFFKSGADVAVVSDLRTSVFKHTTSSIDEIAKMFGEFDFLLVEGLKYLPLPRIAVFRTKLEESYFEYIQAVAIDDTIKKEELKDTNLDILDLNNTQEIIEYIEKNAKRI